MEKELEFVKNRQKEIKLLGKASALLQWDQETYMPHLGIQTRAETLAYLAGLAHEKQISEEFFLATQKLHKNKDKLKNLDRLMVSRLLKDLTKSRNIPKEFVEEINRISTNANNAWKKARKEKNYKIFEPYLRKIIELKRKESSFHNFPGHPYNSLLDDFEEGMTSEVLKPKFEELKEGLIKLLDKIKSSPNYKKQKQVLTKGKFPREKQMILAKDIVKRIGLTEEKTRIDFSEHPFSTDIGLHDVRITTNIREDPLFSFGSSTHEAGHGLYMLNLPEEHFFDSLGLDPSTGIHESQSRLWENMVAKSKPFWDFYYNKFKKEFNLKGSKEEWFKEVNFVKPGEIRIESDEVHYCLHVILRFEIELGLLDGSIKTENLDKVWNQKMKEFFSIEPEHDTSGVLQDVHWSNGYIGYFPTYALGTIYAAQLFAQLKKEHPNLDKEISKGEFSTIQTWLQEKIHKRGRKFLAEDLMKNVCGEGLNIEIYLEYLNNKYKEIYEFN